MIFSTFVINVHPIEIYQFFIYTTIFLTSAYNLLLKGFSARKETCTIAVEKETN